MSVVSETRQRPGASAPRAAAWPARLAHVVVRLLLAAAVLTVVAMGLLAWRLSQGPLDITTIARQIEARVEPADSPTQLQIGHASIAWRGYHEGADRGLEVRLRDVRVVNQSGAPGAAVREADVTVSLGRLLQFQVVPRSVLVSGLRLRALRSSDGAVTFDLGTLTDAESGAAGGGSAPGPSMAQTMAELRRPAGNDSKHGVPGLEMLTQLQHVRVQDAVVEVVDEEFGATLRTTVDGLDLARQRGGGVKGVADGQLALGDATASLHLQADLAPGGGTRLAVALEPMSAAALAKANPALAPVGALDATLDAHATVELSPDLRPRSAELHAAAGGGRVTVRDVALPFDRLSLDAQAAWADGSLKPVHLQLQRMQAVLPSPHGGWSTTLVLSGDASRERQRVSGQFELTLDHVAFADLPLLWPAAWGGNVRPWLTENVTAGTARDGDFKVAVDGPENDLSAIALTQASGSLQGDDVTIHWLRPVPPIEHAQAVMRLAGPDVIEIAVPTARQGPIALKDGLIRFTGLSTKDQFMSVSTNLAGSVADVLTLLRHPRLKLLDKHPIPMRNPAGTLTGKLSVDMPLKKELQFEMVKISAQGRTSGMRLGGLVAGRDLDNADIQFEVTSDGMKASGTGGVAGIASTIGVEMDFRSGPPDQVLQHATMTGRATAKQLAGAGVDPGDLMTAGSAGVSAEYTARRDGQAEVAIKADLKDTGLAVAGWRKAPGPPADAAATLLLRNDKLAGISALHASGPGMLVVGRAEMIGSRPDLLRLERLELGPTRASGEIRFPDTPDDPIRANLSGSVLDLSTQFGKKPPHPAARGGGAAPARGERDTPWIADIRFDRVLLAHERSIGAVSAHAEYDGWRLSVLRADSTGPERVQAVIAPQGSGRRVTVRAADGGAVLRALDVLDSVVGGSLALDAQYDDRYPDPPLAGTLQLSEFALKDAVAVGKLLQAVTVYGVVDAMRGGQALQFSQLVMPFRYAGDVVTMGEARAFSASLGVTAQGRVDTGRNSIDVKGTIVPAYAINSALGRIPLLGRLFSPEHGGGLVAVDYTVRGSLADPAITVNPLSALTPGFLRGLFKIFD